MVAAGGFGNIHGHTLHQKILGAAGAAAFLVLALLTVRATSNEIYRVLRPRTGNGHAAVVRLLINLVGYTVVLFSTLDLLTIPIQHLLLGGALTGVFVGIASQQALGNVCAGLVLLLARPFNIGDHVRVRSGPLGGILTGQVTGMGLSYVNLLTDDGPLSIPNSAMLAAGVGPISPPTAVPTQSAPATITDPSPVNPSPL
ncbi:mechanosensitive ion channel family protein [Frankia sp. AgB1.9]|uniref:mechanosensitive ion channel domain-containing protein n=1 Tax=unclassified Frankia TaxID=2632575 RepID=UPI00193198CD|nr:MULTISPECIES: mechanosensitive ion channel family protein [unclassified Frankia]MBL7493707.1 mechanosensitive ion channel family protein [Frankia sp. AgW1.1]MBL7553007.1 mechanosensitive ion channel family protein [Frankia sp. AgB1.9]MBL7621601.1 mechanosensitive ion channel family protein [Frankia sp. AgB1.8]